MTRIKTIGSLLKAFSTKFRRFPLSYRIAGSGLSLIALLSCLLAPGCRGGWRNINPYTAVIDGFAIKEIEMENVRFEPQGLPFSIQAARAYWLRRSDAITPRWDTVEFHWQREGAMCDFVDNAATEDCQICNYCDPLPPFTGPVECIAGRAGFGGGGPEVVMDPGFIQTDNPQLVLAYYAPNNARSAFGACSNNANASFPLLSFQPEASGLYRMRALQNIIFRGATDGEIKLHVVEKGAGLTQNTAYQLTPQTIDGVNYWTWTMEGDPIWEENFSPNLRVTDIRILKGECGDGSAKGKRCDAPDERVTVKPSRLLFLPSFQGTVSGHPEESSHRCYSAPNASDGNFINLDSCRETYNATQTIQKPATPTYLTDSSGGPRPTERLTWLVEFNTNEGADAMPPDAKLIIEFTIQANN